MTSQRRRWHASFAALLITFAALSGHAATYRIDPNDTTANFDVRFLGVFPMRGEFRRTTGTLIYDRASRQGSIEVFIDATTLEAATAHAQSIARGAEFFAVDRYPSIDFKSSRFIFDESRLKSIEGSLTLVGQTRPVVLTVIDSICVAANEQEPGICRATAELVVKRSAFGMKSWSHTVGEEVTIRILISARQTPEKEPPKVEPKVLPKEAPRDAPKDVSKEAPKEPATETPKIERGLESAPQVNGRGGGASRQAP